MDTPNHSRIIARNGFEYFAEQISKNNIMNMVFGRDETTNFFVEEGLLRVKRGESFNYFPVTDLLEAAEKQYKSTTQTNQGIEEKNKTANSLFIAYQIYDELRQKFPETQEKVDDYLISLGNYSIKLFKDVPLNRGVKIMDTEINNYLESLLDTAKKSFYTAQEIEGLNEIKQIYQNQIPNKNAVGKIDSLIKKIENAPTQKNHFLSEFK